jgi:hypothetical protein
MLIAILVLILSFALTSTAFAAAGEFELARPILDAVMSGDYIWAATAAIVLGVALMRKFGAKAWPPLGSGKAAAIMVVVGSFAGAVLNALTAGEGLSWEVLLTALKVAIFSGGAVALAKELSPMWLRPVLDTLLGSDSADTRLRDAERAGLDAMKSNPSDGTGIEFRDVR